MPGTTLSLTMRPTSFADVIGLEDQVRLVQNKIAEGIPRGFMIVGPYGCGKTTLAQIIAHAVQGLEFADIEPSITEVNAANNRKIEDMRQLVQDAGNYPMVGKYGIIILDEAQQLTKDAQQILLKELERPQSPTVWIIPTTDPEKINKGVRDRCVILKVQPMNKEQRAALVTRAAEVLKHTGDLTEFLAALDKAKVISPRNILMAFEQFHYGMPIAQAVSSVHFQALPEHFHIAIGVLFGKWTAGYTSFLRDAAGAPMQFPPVCEQISLLEGKLKKSAQALKSGEADATEGEVTEEDLQGKTEAANILRVLVGAMLKNNIAKEASKFNPAKAMAAAECLQLLTHAIGPNYSDTGLDYPATIACLYRIHLKMTAAK